MVHYQRNYQVWKKGSLEAIEGGGSLPTALVLECGSTSLSYYKRKTPKILSLLFLSLLSCSFILIYHPSSSSSLLYSFGWEYDGLNGEMGANIPLCSSMSNGSICCDRSSIRSDICFMKGDVRTHSASSSLILYTSRLGEDTIKLENEELQKEKIRPYTRKWETSTMNTIDELSLISKKMNLGIDHKCDVVHDVPAVFFSTGGYTGNVYHEFNDGLLPLYITSQHLNKKVVFVILEYHDWWMTKYGDVVSLLSDYPPIDFSGDNRTHCFHEAIVGMKIHDELAIDPLLMEGNKSIVDFRNVLDQAYWPRIRGLIQDEEREAQLKMNENVTLLDMKKPKLVLLSRNGSRAIINEDSLVKLAEEIGFEVEVVRPDRRMELAKMYRTLNASDVMIGVHGAAMTHLLFMKPGSVFIQVIPLGTDWAAETYYGEPARKLGLKYIPYKVLPRESSLYDKYDKNDPILKDPMSVTARGWEFTKKIYLDAQNVRLDLMRFQKRLSRAYHYSTIKKNRNSHPEQV